MSDHHKNVILYFYTMKVRHTPCYINENLLSVSLSPRFKVLKMPLAIADYINYRDEKCEDVISIDAFHDLVRYENGQYIVDYKDMQLVTAIQPIYSIDHQRTIGYEALIRAKDASGQPVSPIDLFNSPTSDKESVYLDRLCRYVHTANFQHTSNDETWFFINVSALASERGREYGLFFSELLKFFHIKPSNVVVEIIEDPSHDNEKLLDAIKYYKDMGCMLAIDDFGAGHSNFERVWSLKPDIVKLDRSMVTREAANLESSLLPSIVELLHQAGCLVVIEGVENEAQALVAMNSGADFIQGFYFAKPREINSINDNRVKLFKRLAKLHLKNEQIKAESEKAWLAPFVKSFKESVESIQQGNTLEVACLGFYSLTGSIRCYLLNEVGEQIGRTLNFKQAVTTKFKQLQCAEKGNWYRKHYVRNAINNPLRLNISQPYRSITGDGLCMTLSLYFENGFEHQILCFDIISE